MSNLLQGIDVVIFDFGNVLIDLDYPRIIRNFAQVAIQNKDKIDRMVLDAPSLKKFEKGEIGPDRFRAEMCHLIGINLPEDKFDAIWNSMLKSVPRERMRKLLKIGTKWDTYILSNSNITHELAFEEMVMDSTGKLSIRDFVKEVYFSHELGMRKPDAEIYEYVAEDIGIYPSRMLFLDDRLDNVEAAKKVGMKAVQVFDPDKQINEIFGFG